MVEFTNPLSVAHLKRKTSLSIWEGLIIEDAQSCGFFMCFLIDGAPAIGFEIKQMCHLKFADYHHDLKDLAGIDSKLRVNKTESNLE